MVQLLLSGTRGNGLGTARVACILLLLLAPAWASRKPKDKLVEPGPPDLLLEGGRKLSYERSFHSEREVKPKRGFWNRVLDVVAGEPQFHALIRPYSVAADSRGRIIVTDPGAGGVHIFDFAEQKYKFLWRADKRKDAMLQPQCVAVDAQDNIYVTDSDSGKVFVFDANGKYQRAIGSLKGGEGYFKRPTGIAIDSAAQRIYVTDTLRNKIFMLDMQGNILQEIGKNGDANGEFNFPTELRLDRQDLIVVDAMNFRVQMLDRSGTFRLAIGQLGDSTGEMFRPKGVAVDSEGDLYVVDGLWGLVQVFNREGQLLYYFGQRGTGPGQFELPAGLFIDRDDRIFVVDSFNRRIQVFHYFGLPKRARREEIGAKQKSAKEGM
ncbi:MAG: 6-bladed beta-propeller [Candidatus Sulfotelmatobacter sp.]